MENYQNIFKRTEKKYRLSDEEYRALRCALSDRLEPDEYSSATVMSLYFDTPEGTIIGRSLEKPSIYKEKLRIRSYGVPDRDSIVFAELKKKFKGVVYKRRVSLTWAEAKSWLIDGGPAPGDGQVFREIQYFMELYVPAPAALLSYDRIAFHGVEDPTLRVTFDGRIRGRDRALDLGKGPWGEELLSPGEHLMEIKANGAYPLWLCDVLADYEIYPASFSKYGAFYALRMAEKNLTKGGERVAG